MLQVRDQGHGEYVVAIKKDGQTTLLANVRVHHVKRTRRTEKHVKLVTYHQNGRIIAGYVHGRTTGHLNRKLRRMAS